MNERPLKSTELDLRTVTAPELPVHRVFTPAELAAVPGDAAPGDAQPGDGDASVAEFRLAGDVTFDGLVRKQDPRFRLTGRVQTTMDVTCGRCLEPFTLPLDVEVDLTYVPDPSEAGGQEDVELSDEDLTTSYYRHHVLDLGEMLREQFYLALPMRPLCREDCKGLCPQCGTNLNEGSCACEARWEDPRLAGLRTLMKKAESQH